MNQSHWTKILQDMVARTINHILGHSSIYQSYAFIILVEKGVFIVSGYLMIDYLCSRCKYTGSSNCWDDLLPLHVYEYNKNMSS